METKALLYGLIGFFLGGLLVSVAATTFEAPKAGEMSMSQMTESLENKRGDDYDAAFIEHMIDHHQSAVDMAKLSGERAKHAEIKQLSTEIILTQQAEIDEMRRWQKQWGYDESSDGKHDTH